MTKLDKINKIIFHLGKGIWKGIPVIGPIVEEVFYEANKDFLLNALEKEVAKLPQEEIDKLLQVMENNESKIEVLFETFNVEFRKNFYDSIKQIDIKPILIQNKLAEFKEKITKYAFEWEEKMEEAQLLTENGKDKEGEEAFIQSVKPLNKIINSYKSNKFLFKEKVRNEIDEMLVDVETKNNDTSLLTLIKVIQLINYEIEFALTDTM